jgi:hypothetical protein
MPKKFKGENSKATEAKARKTAAQQAEETLKQQRLEDQYWQDDDKHVLKKQQRKEDKEKKKVEQLEKKKEIQKLLDEELVAIKPAPKVAPPSVKVTRLQAEAHREGIAAAATAAATNKDKEPVEPAIEENINRFVAEGEEARTVEQALAILSTKEEEVDIHPEKRMKAAYLAYEERNLPLIKEENPSLRLSQLKQIIRKNWNKALENPLNQQSGSGGAK